MTSLIIIVVQLDDTVPLGIRLTLILYRGSAITILKHTVKFYKE